MLKLCHFVNNFCTIKIKKKQLKTVVSFRNNVIMVIREIIFVKKPHKILSKL